MATVSASAAEIFVDDSRELSRYSLAVKPERIRHNAKDYLLVRIQGTESRSVDMPRGNPEAGRIGDMDLAFLPVKVACDRVALVHEGKTIRPDPASWCYAETRLASWKALPLFVLFRYPGAGKADVSIPIEVMAPDPPIQRTLEQRHPQPQPRVDTALLGAHEITVRFRLD